MNSHNVNMKEHNHECVALDMLNGIERAISYPQQFVKAHNPYEQHETGYIAYSEHKRK